MTYDKNHVRYFTVRTVDCIVTSITMKTALCLSLCALLQLFAATNAATQQIMAPNTRVTRETRIMNGTLATQGQFPYQACVSGINFNNTGTVGLCSGMIISPTRILTAAHCLIYSSEFDVILGTLRFEYANSTGYFVVKTFTKTIHENFNYDTLSNDIGLLTIPSLTYNSNIQPILLPRRSDGDLSLPGKLATVSGWGTTGPGTERSPNLLYAEVKMIIDDYCLLSYGDVTYTPATKLCVTTSNGTEGACNGDSGGPLAYKNTARNEVVAVGIVSFAATAGCDSGFPEVFTRVTAYLDWIASHGGPAVRP